MRHLHLLQAVGLFFGFGKAAPSVPDVNVVPRELTERDPGSCHSPSNRACWSPGFTINTDYELQTPNTGKTRRYNWVISEVENYVGGDGKVKSLAMLINGQFPGPVVWANWGDWIEVTVRNNLTCEGTSIHWHGIRMLENAVNDGANGVTECPIPPGSEKVYRFRAEQYGTSWYHSHYSSQYANGLTGSIQIDGPASLPYDVDLGVFPITDWYYGDAETMQRALIPPPGAAPPSDNILFNGTHVDGDGGGEYYRVKLQPGKRHRLRLINPSVDNHFSVSLVNHDMTVIATDFVPVHSWTASSLFMVPGQRFDVTIDASKTPGNYWFNVTFSSPLCGTSRINNGVDGNTPPAAIFQYDNVPAGTPTIRGTAPTNPNCQDVTSFTPVVPRTIPRSSFIANGENTINVTLANKQWENVPNRVYWDVHGSDMNVTWDDPTLEYIARGELDFPQRFNVHEVTSEPDEWAFWVIENISPVPHPMHLHGHDFYILGHSGPPPPGTTTPRRFIPAQHINQLNFNNPTRRDTSMLPARGWLVLAFRVDNPGAWLFHCHIAWHAGQGLSLQFLERVDEIPGTLELEEIEPICRAWEAYYETAECKQFDSGLKRLKRM